MTPERKKTLFEIEDAAQRVSKSASAAYWMAVEGYEKSYALHERLLMEKLEELVKLNGYRLEKIEPEAAQVQAAE